MRSCQQCELRMYFSIAQRVNIESDTHMKFSSQIINSQRHFVQNREREMPTGLGRELRGAACVWWGQRGSMAGLTCPSKQAQPGTGVEAGGPSFIRQNNKVGFTCQISLR